MRPVHMLALLAVTASVRAARPADACPNAVIYATDANVRAIAQAESKLDDGDPGPAAAIVKKRVTGLNKWDAKWVFPRPDQSKQSLLLNRALRIYALACVRLDGAVGPVAGDAAENVNWGTRVLEQLSAMKKADARSRTDYAEALAKTNGAVAKTILEELADRDVLVTPYAYAALALLRDGAGDATGRDAALARCRTMAAKPSICDAPTPKPPGGT